MKKNPAWAVPQSQHRKYNQKNLGEINFQIWVLLVGSRRGSFWERTLMDFSFFQKINMTMYYSTQKINFMLIWLRFAKKYIHKIDKFVKTLAFDMASISNY